MQQLFPPQPFSLDIKFGARVLPHFSPIIHWPLSKIRKFYDGLQQVSGDKTYKYVTLRTFQELMLFNFDVNFTKRLFQTFDIKKQGRINVFRFITALIWTSYATMTQKINFIFKMFDFDQNGTLTIEELVIILINSIKSLTMISGTYDQSALPKNKISKESTKIFKQIDIDHSESLTIDEVTKWIGNWLILVEFLEIFEPKTKTLQQPWIFMNFPSVEINNFEQEPLNTMGTIQHFNKPVHSISQKYAKKSFNQIEENQLPQILADSSPTKLRMARSVAKHTRSVKKLEVQEIAMVSQFQQQTILPMTVRRITNYDDNNNTIKMPYMSHRNSSCQNFFSPNKLNDQLLQRKINVLTIKGKTYTKNDVFELKRFYDEMDREKKGFITFEDYARNFKLISNSKKHAKNVFETIDKKKNGRICLEDFMKVSIPGIAEKEMAIVLKWMKEPNQYNEDMLKKIERPTGYADESLTINKKILPKQTVREFTKMFDIFNTDRSGLMSMGELKTMLRKTYKSEHEINQILDKKRLYILQENSNVSNFEKPQDLNVAEQIQLAQRRRSSAYDESQLFKKINVEQFISLMKPSDTYVSVATLQKIRQQYDKKINHLARGKNQEIQPILIEQLEAGQIEGSNRDLQNKMSGVIQVTRLSVKLQNNSKRLSKQMWAEGFGITKDETDKEKDAEASEEEGFEEFQSGWATQGAWGQPNEEEAKNSQANEGQVDEEDDNFEWGKMEDATQSKNNLDSGTKDKVLNNIQASPELTSELKIDTPLQSETEVKVETAVDQQQPVSHHQEPQIDDDELQPIKSNDTQQENKDTHDQNDQQNEKKQDQSSNKSDAKPEFQEPNDQIEDDDGEGWSNDWTNPIQANQEQLVDQDIDDQKEEDQNQARSIAEDQQKQVEISPEKEQLKDKEEVKTNQELKGDEDEQIPDVNVNVNVDQMLKLEDYNTQIQNQNKNLISQINDDPELESKWDAIFQEEENKQQTDNQENSNEKVKQETDIPENQLDSTNTLKDQVLNKQDIKTILKDEQSSVKDEYLIQGDHLALSNDTQTEKNTNKNDQKSKEAENNDQPEITEIMTARGNKEENEAHNINKQSYEKNNVEEDLTTPLKDYEQNIGEGKAKLIDSQVKNDVKLSLEDQNSPLRNQDVATSNNPDSNIKDEKMTTGTDQINIDVVNMLEQQDHANQSKKLGDEQQEEKLITDQNIDTNVVEQNENDQHKNDGLENDVPIDTDTNLLDNDKQQQQLNYDEDEDDFDEFQVSQPIISNRAESPEIPEVIQNQENLDENKLEQQNEQLQDQIEQNNDEANKDYQKEQNLDDIQEQSKIKGENSQDVKSSVNNDKEKDKNKERAIQNKSDDQQEQQEDGKEVEKGDEKEEEKQADPEAVGWGWGQTDNQNEDDDNDGFDEFVQPEWAQPKQTSDVESDSDKSKEKDDIIKSEDESTTQQQKVHELSKDPIPEQQQESSQKDVENEEADEDGFDDFVDAPVATIETQAEIKTEANTGWAATFQDDQDNQEAEDGEENDDEAEGWGWQSSQVAQAADIEQDDKQDEKLQDAVKQDNNKNVEEEDDMDDGFDEFNEASPTQKDSGPAQSVVLDQSPAHNVQALVQKTDVAKSGLNFEDDQEDDDFDDFVQEQSATGNDQILNESEDSGEIDYVDSVANVVSIQPAKAKDANKINTLFDIYPNTASLKSHLSKQVLKISESKKQDKSSFQLNQFLKEAPNALLPSQSADNLSYVSKAQQVNDMQSKKRDHLIEYDAQIDSSGKSSKMVGLEGFTIDMKQDGTTNDPTIKFNLSKKNKQTEQLMSLKFMNDIQDNLNPFERNVKKILSEANKLWDESTIKSELMARFKIPIPAAKPLPKLAASQSHHQSIKTPQQQNNQQDDYSPINLKGQDSSKNTFQRKATLQSSHDNKNPILTPGYDKNVMGARDIEADVEDFEIAQDYDNQMNDNRYYEGQQEDDDTNKQEQSDQAAIEAANHDSQQDYVKETFARFGLNVGLYTDKGLPASIDIDTKQKGDKNSSKRSKVQEFLDLLPDYGFLLDVKLALPQTFFND